ncbi:rho guanine nucleotide exchange factor 18a [Archocentrus centrarchus]|uniref:rho guanine nucleotide exchange factor 18a n=1 Tax=Archocentrus centrarchus TaxID=63155 RepID=UPI0011EA0214|nr:rho guanine nucleotide exchange factor 18-like [Archocentrus centrarchus]XP_030607960.1 rho guanine nucleotide exchange factor 18-like [Archocentrus centrarchus]
MDELDSRRERLRLSSEDLTDPINLEDSHYTLLQLDLETDAQNLEADSWSLVVDQNYLKTLNKADITKQDIVYELIKTEMHLVHTLKIMLHVYMHELKQSQLIEEDRLRRIFLGIEPLRIIHQHFLKCLKIHHRQSQEEGNPIIYQISEIADTLISQFSGTMGERMKDCYGMFCARHLEADRSYKELIQGNKKLQALDRKIGQLSLVRRMGISDCLLLVTQRITKYPVLVERLIQNTEVGTDEYRSLGEALEFIKNTIMQVNAQIKEYEKAARVREIGQRLDPKSVGRLNGDQVIRREDLIQGNRKVVHEGAVTWKSSGKQKDVHAVLLSDMLLLLQEKDQRLVFAAVDNKPPVISLERLIVREVAMEERAIFLISARTIGLPEMYEIHTGSREERITWEAIIREAMERHQEEVQYHEMITTLQTFQDHFKLRDDQIKMSLAEKQQLLAALYKHVTGQETPHDGLLLGGGTNDLKQLETLLKGAIDDVEILQNLFALKMSSTKVPVKESNMQGRQLRRAQTFGEADSKPAAGTMKNGDDDGDSLGEDRPLRMSHSYNEYMLQGFFSEDPEQCADEETTALLHCNSTSINFPEAEVYDRVIMLAQRLYSLYAIIAQQDSQNALQHAFQSQNQQPTNFNNALFEYEKQRSLDKQREELNNLNKQQAQLREEQQRWEKEKERHRCQMEALEAQVKQKEDERRKLEEKLNKEKLELEMQKESYQHDLERLRETTRSVEKEKERVAQEKERLEKLKMKRVLNIGQRNYDDPSQLWNYSSFRGSVVNGSIPTFIPPTNSLEIPPKVPPRRESILVRPSKSKSPSRLHNTTNQVHKPAPVQQQIPEKLAVAKGKDKSSKKKTHKRAQSAASIELTEVAPIQVTGKGGGSLRSQKKTSPERTLNADTFRPPASVQNVKMPQPSSVSKLRITDTPPPPPPFPKEVIRPPKEKEIFL